jgi:hypothetical protein
VKDEAFPFKVELLPWAKTLPYSLFALIENSFEMLSIISPFEAL